SQGADAGGGRGPCVDAAVLPRGLEETDGTVGPDAPVGIAAVRVRPSRVEGAEEELVLIPHHVWVGRIEIDGALGGRIEGLAVVEGEDEAEPDPGGEHHASPVVQGNEAPGLRVDAHVADEPTEQRVPQ